MQSRCWSCPQCHIQGTLVGKSLGAAAVSRAFPVLTGSWWLPRANVNKKITVLGGTPENRSLQMSAEEILAAFFFFFFYLCPLDATNACYGVWVPRETAAGDPQ